MENADRSREPADHDTSLSAQLRAAYASAWVEVELSGGRFVFPPVARGAPRLLPSALRPHGFVITACNPRSEVLDPEENATRTRSLAQSMRAERWTIFPAVNHDGSGGWREESFAVVAPPVVELLALARRFSQNAVYEWGDRTWRIVEV